MSATHRPHPGRHARKRATLHKQLKAIVALIDKGDVKEARACLQAAVNALAPKAKEAAE